jgi:hypothetical protein
VSSAGEVSDWATIAPAAVTTVPQSPTATLGVDRDGRLLVVWEPRHDGGDPVASARYRVDDGDWVTVRADRRTVTDDLLPRPGQSVRVELQVRNAGGWSEATEVTGVPVPGEVQP